MVRARVKAIATALVLLLLATRGFAETILVDATCTLAQAITEANEWTNNTGDCEAGDDAGGGATGEDTIILSADITLTSSLPFTITNIIIDGSDGDGGRYTISGDGQYGVIYHDHGDLRLQNLILTKGRTNTSYGSVYSDSGTDDPLTIHNSRIINSDLSGVAGSKGAGVYKEGRGALTITQSVITGNKAAQAGGGVYSESPTSISRSAIHGNSAGSGGGVYITGEDSSLALTNSTIFNNTASSAGGGLYAGPAASVALKHATIVKNSAAADSAGGIYVTTGGADINVLNNILYDNSNGDCKLARDEDFTGAGGGVVVKDNIIEAHSCGGLNLTDDPELAAEATGDIPYYSFSTTSPAIDAVDCPDGVTVDQIGTSRPQGDACDIGAYEGPGTFVQSTPTPTDTPTNTPTDTPTNTPTDTPTNTPTDTPTNTPTDTPTNTPTDTPTNTPTDTPTNTPTDTPTNTPTDTPTNTPADTPTNTPTDTPTNTPTDTPTNTPTNTPTDTPTNTPTDTPTNTPTDTPTNTPTNTPTPRSGSRQPKVKAAPQATATPKKWCEQDGPEETWLDAIPLGAIACIFRGDGQFHVYEVDRQSRGFFKTRATQEQVDEAGWGLVAASTDGRAAIFVVEDGDVIVAVGPDLNGKIANMRFEHGLYGRVTSVYTTYGAPPGLGYGEADGVLNDCVVTTTTYVNFRERPDGAILETLPHPVKLTAVERRANWFKVDWYGRKGWISAGYVTTHGNCG